MNRSKAPGASGLITFLYYRDLDRAAAFYADIMGFELAVDQKWAKIFKVAGGAHIGCVDGSVGYHEPSDVKPVLITVVVDDPDAWYAHLRRRGVATIDEPHDDEELGLRIFFVEDPEGYVLEIQMFREPTRRADDGGSAEEDRSGPR